MMLAFREVHFDASMALNIKGERMMDEGEDLIVADKAREWLELRTNVRNSAWSLTRRRTASHVILSTALDLT